MAEIRFLVGLACYRLFFIQTFHAPSLAGQLKIPILGCTIAFLAGCSTMGSNQAMKPPAPGPITAAPSKPHVRFEDTARKSELILPDHSSIDTWVRRFSEDKHQSFQTQLDRSRFYVVPVQEIFERQGLPKDIVFVALVESGFSPTAQSHAKAVGMWQFIASTGKRFGLEQNPYIDERRHPFKAARAAAEYLSFLYDTFGSWSLALAAYNAGENAVQRALDQSGLKTFWELADSGFLPAETRDYVPKVMATVKIVRDARRYGFHFDPKHYVERHEILPVPGGVELASIEKKTGLPRSALLECNPELCKPQTPPWCSSYDLCVPMGTRDIVLKALAEGLPEEKPEVKELALVKAKPTFVHRISRGDTWFNLSRKYGCTPQELAGMNGCTSSSTLKVGAVLKVPDTEPLMALSEDRKKETSGKAKTTAKVAASHPPSSGKRIERSATKPTRSARASVQQGTRSSSSAPVRKSSAATGSRPAPKKGR